MKERREKRGLRKKTRKKENTLSLFSLIFPRSFLPFLSLPLVVPDASDLRGDPQLFEDAPHKGPRDADASQTQGSGRSDEDLGTRRGQVIFFLASAGQVSDRLFPGGVEELEVLGDFLEFGPAGGQGLDAEVD